MFFSKLYAGTANKIYTYNGTDWEISFNALEDAYYAISFITFNNMIYAGMSNGYIFASPSFQMPAIDTVAVPEFPSFLILPLFMIATLLAVIVYKREHQTLVQTFTIVTFFETRDSDQLFRSGVLQIFAQDFSDNVHLKA